MRILFLEPSPGSATGIASALAAAGHTILRCSAPGVPAFPCADVVAPGSCPLGSSEPADVVLDVRDPYEVDISAAEAGVSCAIRDGVPVVVDTAGGPNPFGDWVTEVGPEETLVDACSRAIRASARADAAPLLDEAARIVERAGGDPEEVAVALERVGSTAHIAVTIPGELPVEASSIATRVHARHRETARRQADIVEVGVRTRT